MAEAIEKKLQKNRSKENMSIPYRISGSRATAILGLSPYQTQVQIWLELMEEMRPGFCEKHGYLKPEFEKNPSMIWGTAFEDEIINIVQRIHGIKIEDREKLFTKDEFLSCHPDGLSADLLIENKTTSEYYYRDNFGDEETDKIPISYQVQIQHNMICTERKKCMMPLLIFPKRPDDYVNNDVDIEKIDKKKWIEVLYEMGNLKFYYITAHPELQQEMIKHYTEFWNENILGEKVPDPKSYDDIKALCPVASGTLIANENIERLAAEYKNITQEIGNSGQLAKRKEMIRVEILKYMIEQNKRVEKILDDDSIDKFILRTQDGKKLFQWDGKTFR